MTKGTSPKTGISISDYINTWGKLLLHNKLATPEQWSNCVADFKRQGGKLPIETIVVMMDVVDDAKAKAIKARVKEILIKKHPGQAMASSKQAIAQGKQQHAGAAPPAAAAAPEPEEVAAAADGEGSDIDNDPDIIAALARIADDDDDSSGAQPAAAQAAEASSDSAQATQAATPPEAADEGGISLEADDASATGESAAADPLDQPLTMDDADDDADDAADIASAGSGQVGDALIDDVVEPAAKPGKAAAPAADADKSAAGADLTEAIDWDEGVIELSDGDEGDAETGNIEWTHEVIASEIKDTDDIILDPTDEMWEALFNEAPLLAAGERRETVKAALRDTPEVEDDDGESYDLDVEEGDDRNDHLSEVDWADGLIGSEDETK